MWTSSFPRCLSWKVKRQKKRTVPGERKPVLFFASFLQHKQLRVNADRSIDRYKHLKSREARSIIIPRPLILPGCYRWPWGDGVTLWRWRMDMKTECGSDKMDFSLEDRWGWAWCCVILFMCVCVWGGGLQKPRTDATRIHLTDIKSSNAKWPLLAIVLKQIRVKLVSIFKQNIHYAALQKQKECT